MDDRWSRVTSRSSTSCGPGQDACFPWIWFWSVFLWPLLLNCMFFSRLLASALRLPFRSLLSLLFGVCRTSSNAVDGVSRSGEECVSIRCLLFRLPLYCCSLSFSHGPSVGAETKIVKRPHREQEEWDFLLLLRDHHHIKGAGEQSGKTLPTPLSVSHSNFRRSLQRPVPLQNISQRKNASDKTFTDVFPRSSSRRKQRTE
jgi:hypothetical protein